MCKENTCSGTGTGIGKFNLYINTSHINLLTIPDGDATSPSSDDYIFMQHHILEE
jgi:hypothetical protein